MAPRPPLREYDSAVAVSPTRHAIINRPFMTLRRRTENLLDQITGGTVAKEAVEQQRQLRERERACRCRGCRMVFADEGGLARHYDLFPKHVHPPETRRKATPTTRLSRDEHRESHRPRRSRTQSTPGLYSESLSSTGPEPNVKPSVAKSSRPLPQKPYQAASPPRDAFYAPPSAFAAATTPIRRATHTRSQTLGNIMQPGDVLMGGAEGHDRAIYAEYYRPAAAPPYTLMHPAMETGALLPPRAEMPLPLPLPPRQVASPEPMEALYQHAEKEPPRSSLRSQDPQSSVDSQPPILPSLPSLPTFDFESSFQQISSEGVRSPPTARQVPKSPAEDFPYGDPIGDRNRQRGERSAAVTAMRRGRPERRRERSEGSIDMLASRKSFSDMMRAVVATGATGSEGAAVFPESTLASGRGPLRSQSTWLPLPDDSEQSQPAEPQGNWMALLDALPGSPRAERKQASAKGESPLQPLRPVRTGLTTFSQDEDELPSPSSQSGDNGVPPRPTRGRQFTNPFLNSEFMRSLPGMLKTPPLSPSSPFESPRGRRASPANPFVQLAGEEDAQEIFYDAEAFSAPKTLVEAQDASFSRLPPGSGFADAYPVSYKVAQLAH